LRLALTLQDYSDGNQSRSLYLGAGQRVVSRAAYKLTLLGDIYSGSSDTADVPYFSPRQSISWSAGLSNDWAMYRRYDFGLAHNLTAKAGQTNQSGYDAASTWSLDYRFQADFNSRWNTYVGISRNSNVYDGQREYATFVIAGLRATRHYLARAARVCGRAVSRAVIPGRLLSRHSRRRRGRLRHGRIRGVHAQPDHAVHLAPGS
jgi:hypothetical protein